MNFSLDMCWIRDCEWNIERFQYRSLVLAVPKIKGQRVVCCTSRLLNIEKQKQTRGEKEVKAPHCTRDDALFHDAQLPCLGRLARGISNAAEWRLLIAP
jgi:hypothetical protein